MSCEQVEEFEETTAAKDQEIADLKLRLAGQTAERRSSPTLSVDSSIAELMPHTSTTRQMRRGRAPPVEMFSGENPGTHLDDWLPSLHCAANWNNWTEEEQLMQLAGHLNRASFGRVESFDKGGDLHCRRSSQMYEGTS